MKQEAIESIVAVAMSAMTMLAMTAQNVTPAPEVWITVNITEVISGFLGGLVGSVSYAAIRRPAGAFSVIVSIMLAALWASFLGPIFARGATVAWPHLVAAFADPVVIALCGALVGALGLEFYKIILRAADTLNSATPRLVERVVSWIAPHRKPTDNE